MTESKRYRVVGYAKLAKLWERSAESAVAYQEEFFHQKFDDAENMTLVGVYVDITGAKQIYNRPEMLKVLHLCTAGEVDLIAMQTRAYLAANTVDFCYVIQYLDDLPFEIDLMTFDEDMRIDTLRNVEDQKAELIKMVHKLISLDEAAYQRWKKKIQKVIQEM